MSSTMNYWRRALIAAALVALAGCADRVVAPAVTAPAARFNAAGTSAFQALAAPAHGDVVVSRVIDQRGGALEAATAYGRRLGYTLVVPSGTVGKPTTFTLSVLAGQRYEVELTATQGEKDVGGKLRRSVVLTISTGDSPAGRLPRGSKLYYLPKSGAPQAMAGGAVPALGYVLGVLPHFSRYCIGVN